MRHTIPELVVWAKQRALNGAVSCDDEHNIAGKIRVWRRTTRVNRINRRIADPVFELDEPLIAGVKLFRGVGRSRAELAGLARERS